MLQPVLSNNLYIYLGKEAAQLNFAVFNLLSLKNMVLLVTFYMYHNFNINAMEKINTCQ